MYMKTNKKEIQTKYIYMRIVLHGHFRLHLSNAGYKRLDVGAGHFNLTNGKVVLTQFYEIQFVLFRQMQDRIEGSAA